MFVQFHMFDENKSFLSIQSYIWESKFLQHQSILAISIENDTKQQNKTELSNVADFEVRNIFRLDLTSFTLVWENRSFPGNS